MSQLGGIGQFVAEGVRGGDEMVGGEEGEGGGGVALVDEATGPGNGGGGVAAHGLAMDVFAGKGGEGAACGVKQAFGGDDVAVLGGDEAFEALAGLGKEALAAEQGEELLGAGLGGEWPEAFAGAAGEDEGVEVHGGVRE